MTDPTPSNIDVDKKQGLTIIWADGERSVYSIAKLRSSCPCAKCREERNEKRTRKTLLNVLPGNYADELVMVNVELVGNYALKIGWSDGHDTGIYSFRYLRELT